MFAIDLCIGERVLGVLMWVCGGVLISLGAKRREKLDNGVVVC